LERRKGRKGLGFRESNHQREKKKRGGTQNIPTRKKEAPGNIL